LCSIIVSLLIDYLEGEVDSVFYFSEEEKKAHNPPTSVVPRLHAISYKNIKEGNGLLMANASSSAPYSPTSLSVSLSSSGIAMPSTGNNHNNLPQLNTNQSTNSFLPKFFFC
jgi:hypothetical protein